MNKAKIVIGLTTLVIGAVIHQVIGNIGIVILLTSITLSVLILVDKQKWLEQ